MDIHQTLSVLETVNLLTRRENTVEHYDSDTIKQMETVESHTGKTPGILRIARGTCPRSGTNSMACMFCPNGHMLECHYPMSCEEAQCSHWEDGSEEAIGDD